MRWSTSAWPPSETLRKRWLKAKALVKTYRERYPALAVYFPEGAAEERALERLLQRQVRGDGKVTRGQGGPHCRSRHRCPTRSRSSPEGPPA